MIVAIPEASSTKATVHQMDESGEGAVKPKGASTRQTVTPPKLTEAHLPGVRSLEVAVRPKEVTPLNLTEAHLLAVRSLEVAAKPK